MIKKDFGSILKLGLPLSAKNRKLLLKKIQNNKRIFELFIKPLLMQKPSGWPHGEWLNQVIAAEREILRYLVKSRFEMPGKKMVCGDVESWDSTERQMVKNQQLYIRFDKHLKDQIDIEVFFEHDLTLVFRLNYKQFLEIERYLKPHPFSGDEMEKYEKHIFDRY